MVPLKVFLISTLIAVAMCHPGSGECKDKKHHKHHETMKKCWKETEELKECCPFPKNDEEMKSDPECGEHLDGVEEKQGKEKWKAMTCFTECSFKKKGLINDQGEIDVDKLKEGVEKYLDDKGEPEFKDISLESIDSCFEKFEAKKEQWKKWGEKHNKTQPHDGPEGPKCSMLPAGLVGCMKQNVVRNCPESKWQATEECEALKDAATPMDECMK